MANFHVILLDPRKLRRFTIVGTKKMAVFDDTESEENLRYTIKGKISKEPGQKSFLLLLSACVMEM